ncbi:AEC family transporter [Anaeromicrobium sediminis]|uniref:Malate permease n=1 Tax=Anaeromicrobium sediminis TaxID=1478221 RepID=A0A267MIN1_9FIRM|nr:AEC family transporter [Anaeromicrobium sediminis]PAB59307.1 malate permease [Anaeromicrobium sediminis]
MNEIFSKLMPIILLLILGFFMKEKNMIKRESVDGIKKIVINMALPSVLFMTFVRMELKKEYFLLTIVIIGFLYILYLCGILINKINFLSNKLNPFVTTGFCFGLLGIPLYETVFGYENLHNITILGIGHEMFMWFIFFNILRMKFKKEKFSMGVIRDFCKSPIIISIVLGIFINLWGFYHIFEEISLLKGLYKTIMYLGSLATPLILIIIGYGLELKKKYMKDSIKLTAIRMGVILLVGYMVKYMVIDRIIDENELFNYAYFTFLILPPPFALPLFVGEYSNEEDKNIANNTVVLSTVLSIVLYIGFILLKV